MSQADGHISTPMRKPASAARVVIFVALAYAVLGAAGLTLATASGYASPVFPAAGVALACLLWFERRALPGIWLGAAFVNMLPACLNGTIGPATTAVALLIATGATAQAWAGCWLVNRLLGPAWRNLEREQDAFCFLLYGGLLAGVISSSIGVTGLYAASVIEPAEFLFTWWNWYVGDVLGILVFAPLTLCLLNGPGELWRERRRRIVLPMLVTLSLVTLAFYGTAYWERQAQDNYIQNDGEAIARRISDRLITHREVLSSLQHFIEVTPEFTFRQFEQFTSVTLQDNPDIFALNFSDLIPDERRSSFERTMSRLSPLGPFQITEWNKQRRMVRAKVRPEYVVIRYIVPLAGNEPAVGYDIYSEPIRHAVINRAKASKSMTVTLPIQLVQDQKNRVGILELLPVSVPTAGDSNKEARLLGFAGAVVKVDEMMDIATRGHVPAGMAFQLIDLEAPDIRGLLYRSNAQSAGNKPSALTASWKTALRMGDRDWELTIYINKSYRQQHRPWMAWVVSAGGLLFSALLQILMLGMTGRTAVIKRKNEEIQDMARSLEEKVTERTAQLSEANYKLSEDITERKKAEDALKRSEEQVRLLLNSTAEAIYGIDLDGNCTFANPSCVRMLGYADAQQLLGKNMHRLIHHSHLDGNPMPVEECKIYRAFHEGRKVHTDDEVLWRADGTSFPVEYWSHPQIANSEVSGAVVTFIDITERRMIEDSLRNMSLATEASPAAVVITDPHGNITYVNAKFTEVTGYNYNQVIGRNPRILKSGETSPETYQQLWQTITSGKTWKGEFHNKKKNGELYWEDASISPMTDEKGNITNFIAVKEDITERKKAEKELTDINRQLQEAIAMTNKMAAQAQAANQAKSDFLASMSHEIRTPMNAIIGMADLLWDSSLTEEQRRYVQVFRSAGENLLSLINDILDLSKIEAGQATIQSVPFSLPDLLTSILDMMTFKAAEKKLALTCTIAPDIGKEFVGDPDRLRQILINIIGNAIKFTAAGSVHIKVEKVEENGHSGLIESPDTIGLLFTVKDTGVGIPQEMLETIFEKFTRVDSSLSRKAGGTGLGLAISRQLAGLMGGKIRVESTEGTGSTFYFTVFLKKRGQTSAIGRDEEKTQAFIKSNGKAERPLNILLVEDNEDNRLLIRAYLKKLHHTLEIAVNGQEAVDKVYEGRRYDIIFMDVQMPVMDGYTATRHIRDWEKERKLQPTIIIVLTAHALQEDEQRSIAAGCDGHLTKPIKKQAFLDALQKFC